MPRGKRRSDDSNANVAASIVTPQLSLGYQQITDLTNAVGLDVPHGCCFALIQAEGANVRWRDDGEDPAATVGMRLLSGEERRYDGNLSSIKFIQEGSGAKINISYYG